jgi:hypothetical protein
MLSGSNRRLSGMFERAISQASVTPMVPAISTVSTLRISVLVTASTMFGVVKTSRIFSIDRPGPSEKACTNTASSG